MTRRDREVSPKRGNLGLEQRVLGVFRSLASALPAGPLVASFSGGPDSLALLVILGQLRPVLGRDLLALHVDHGLRTGSRVDAVAAQELAWELGISLHVERLEPGLLARHPGAGAEEAARRERYWAASRLCAATGGTFVTGHHADDQAETILLHLLRGSGVTGAGGMRTLTRLSVPWWSTPVPVPGTILPVVRPLLDLRRSELEAYLADRRPDLRPVLDPTNVTDAYRRNVVRQRIMPEAERAFPGAVGALTRFARIAAEESDLLDIMAGGALVSATDVQRRLSRSALAAQPVAIARRVIRGWLAAVAQDLDPTLERVEAIRELSVSPADRWTIEAGAGHEVHADGDRLTLAPPGPLDRAVTR